LRRLLRLGPTWCAGLLWGAFVPAVIVSAGMLTPHFLPFAIGITLVHAFVLGLPVALLFVWRRWTGLLPAVGAGFLIGLIPIVIFSWPPEIVDIRSSALIAGAFGALGSIGAATFWFVLRLCGALSPKGPASSRPGAFLAVVGVFAVVGGFVIL
jgi:hypothetical protein